jgi:hypothetical protein
MHSSCTGLTWCCCQLCEHEVCRCLDILVVLQTTLKGGQEGGLTLRSTARHSMTHRGERRACTSVPMSHCASVRHFARSLMPDPQSRQLASQLARMSYFKLASHANKPNTAIRAHTTPHIAQPPPLPAARVAGL